MSDVIFKHVMRKHTRLLWADCKLSSHFGSVVNHDGPGPGISATNGLDVLCDALMSSFLKRYQEFDICVFE